MAEDWALNNGGCLWIKVKSLPLPPPPRHPDGSCMWSGHGRGGHPLADAWGTRPDGTWGRMCPYCLEPVKETVNG